MTFVAARSLIAGADLRRLLGVRLTGQFADGVFQASLAGAVLFNPERQAHAADIAAAFAVLLLPYSVLAPFVGVFLDRWWRQRVLVGANLLRAVLVCVVATEIGTGVSGVPFYLGALAAISVNRFVLSALSASLPHTIDSPRLVSANALTTTAGALAASVGGGAAVICRAFAGSGNHGSALVAVTSAAFYLLAALLARGFGTEQLGPDDETRTHRESARHVISGFAAGMRHLRTHPSVVRALGVIAIHRFLYGMAAISTLLLYRNYFTSSGVLRAGLPGLAQVVLGVALGTGAAAVVTPSAARRWGYVRWPAGLLIGAGLIEWAFVLPFRMGPLLIATTLLGFVAQGVKICVDTTVAQRVSDEYRGRAFSIYDTLFNVVFVVAAVVTVFALPESGRSTIAVAAIGAAYLLTGAVYYFMPDSDRPLRARHPAVGPPTTTSAR